MRASTHCHTLMAPTRFDNFTSVMSNPIVELSRARTLLKETAAIEIKTISIPENVWAIMLQHPAVIDALKATRFEPLFEFTIPLMKIRWHGFKSPSYQNHIETLLHVPRGTIHIESKNGSSIVFEDEDGDAYTIKDVVEFVP